MSYIKVELKYPHKNETIFGDIYNTTVDGVLKELEKSAIDQNKNIVCELHKEKSKGTIVISLRDSDKKRLT